MNKTIKPNFLIISISNLLFCTLLVICVAILSFNFKFEYERLLSLIILLLTVIYSGYTTAKTSSNKKLIYAFISSTIFFLTYLICSFLYVENFSFNQAYIICMLNIYFGTFVGCVLSANRKQRKGRK